MVGDAPMLTFYDELSEGAPILVPASLMIGVDVAGEGVLHLEGPAANSSRTEVYPRGICTESAAGRISLPTSNGIGPFGLQIPGPRRQGLPSTVVPWKR